MANLKIGTIGLGRLGYHHTKNVTRTFGAELVAVADAFPDALKRGETDFGVKGYADYHDLILKWKPLSLQRRPRLTMRY